MWDGIIILDIFEAEVQKAKIKIVPNKFLYLFCLTTETFKRGVEMYAY